MWESGHHNRSSVSTAAVAFTWTATEEVSRQVCPENSAIHLLQSGNRLSAQGHLFTNSSHSRHTRSSAVTAIMFTFQLPLRCLLQLKTLQSLHTFRHIRKQIFIMSNKPLYLKMQVYVTKDPALLAWFFSLLLCNLFSRPLFVLIVKQLVTFVKRAEQINRSRDCSFNLKLPANTKYSCNIVEHDLYSF